MYLISKKHNNIIINSKGVTKLYKKGQIRKSMKTSLPSLTLSQKSEKEDVEKR